MNGLAVYGWEGGAQDFMALNDLIQAPFQSDHIQCASQVQGGGNVVERTVRFELIEEPQALLGKRQRYFTLTICWTERYPLLLLLLLLSGFNTMRQGGNGRLFKQCAQGDFHLECLAHARDHLRGQQRMPAQRKEIIVQADLRHAQHLRPDGCDGLLGRRARRDIVCPLVGRSGLHRG